MGVERSNIKYVHFQHCVSINSIALQVTERFTVNVTTKAVLQEKFFDSENNPMFAINEMMGSLVMPIQIFPLTVIYFELGSGHFSRY